MARYLLKVARSKGWRLVILDPKRQWMVRDEDGKRTKFPYGELTEDFRGSVDSPILVTKFDPSVAVSIREDIEWNDDLDSFLKTVLAYGDTIVYFDEITQFVSNAFAPRTMKVLWTQGLASGIKSWAGSQRPRLIPEFVKSEANTWIIFRLIKAEDRETVSGYIPTDDTPELEDKPLEPKWFWFYDQTMKKPMLFPPLKIGTKI